MDTRAVTALQSIQNAAARLVTRTKKFEHITPVLFHLHWLPVHQRIKFKIALLTFKILSGECPDYMVSMIDIYTPNRSLRSSDKFTLSRRDTPSTTKNYGHRAFTIAAPIIWNSLPFNIRSISKIEVFKRSLKTHLFNIAYD